MIDLEQEICNVSENEEEINRRYTEMDKYYTAICLIQEFGNDPAMLEKAGIALAKAIVNGDFKASYPDLNQRNAHINDVITATIANTIDIELTEKYSADIILWWQEMVLEQNFYIDPETGEKSEIVPNTANIGATDYDEYCAKMKDTGSFYMYCVADATTINTIAARYKKQQQSITLDRIEATGVGLSKRVMQNNINAGILAKTGKNANQAVESIKKGKDPAIGSLFATIVSAIVAIVGLVKSIFDKKKAQIEKETAEIMSQSNLNAIAPNTIDWDINGDGIPDAIVDPNTNQIVQVLPNANNPLSSLQTNTDAGLPTWMLLAGAGVLLYLFL
jgi:hypothetical protein